ncbi:hypothetical protein SNARM312S_07563 [Streptomyces narbonensis]
MTRLHRLRDTAANVAILASCPICSAMPAPWRKPPEEGHEREEAYAIYAVCCEFAHTAARSPRPPRARRDGLRAGRLVDRLSGDPVLPAVADWMRVWDMWATADWEDALTLSDKAIGSVQQAYEHGDLLAVRAWGTLQLRAAISAARAGRPSEAEDRIGYAKDAAERMDAYVGAPVYDRHSLTFSAGNVQIHAISVALEMGEQGKALEINRRTSPELVGALPNSRQGHHHMDIARAWLWDGNRDKALVELETAERIAPQLVRNHPIARSTLRSIVYAERAATREKLRRMSDRFHLDG